MTELSDEILMQRVRNGNLSELSELFERYHKTMYNFFLKLTHDQITSQDLTQNLFYRIIKYRRSFKKSKKFKSWIYQMARNIHIDYCNQKNKMADRIKNTAMYNENVIENNERFSQEEYSRLDKAMLKLKPEQQEIIVLSRFQGLKYEEISKIRNVSVAAIKVQVHRALKQLKDIYFKQI